jgi:hypothetical protein
VVVAINRQVTGSSCAIVAVISATNGKVTMRLRRPDGLARPGRYHARHESLVPLQVGWGTTVTADARDRLVALLATAAAPGAFSARRTAPVDDLHIEVRGVGQVILPVSETQAMQLSKLGRPARFGRGEQTLVDARVRDTCEIPKSRVKIDKRRWDNTPGTSHRSAYALGPAF